jgi:predicted MFS family arabinose efflux permease
VTCDLYPLKKGVTPSLFFLGLQETVYAVAIESGGTLMGVLFHALGTQLTLLLYSTSCAAVLVTVLFYICFAKYEDNRYQKLTQDSYN